MGHGQRALRIGLLLFIAIVIALPAAAGDIVAFNAGPSGVSWQPLIPFEHGVLTVSTPDGLVFQEDFKGAGGVSFNPFAHADYRASDGTYVWQVLLGQPSTVNPRLRAAARANRAGDGDPDVEAAHRAASTRATQVQSGGFRILNGAIVPSNLVEPGSAARGAAPRSMAPDAFRQADWPQDDPSVRPVDQVIPDDLIVQGSACIGLDCVNNESFGFDTIRMKENNTRIKFEDTSVGAFPTNDWQLTANESASGGQSKFSIEDITGARVPFTVEAGATTNSLYVDSTGRIGLRTATPVLDLHINTSNTPAVRLEQNSSGGFTAQTWDIAGNEANFFIRDVTGGSRLPFRIRPGAPTSSIDISADGDVGIGTASPNAKLDVFGGGVKVGAASDSIPGAGQELVLSPVSGTVAGILFQHNTVDTAFVKSSSTTRLTTIGANAGTFIAIRHTNGQVGIGTTNPTNPLEMASGARVTAAGVWTDASSRAVKQDIRELTAAEAQIAFEQLAPVRYTSKIDPTEQHVGFIAEDVPDLVATKDRKALSPMDIVAVLTRVVQEQQKTIAELASKIEALQAAQDSPRASGLDTPTGLTTHRQ